MNSLLVNEFEPSDDHAAIREGVRSVVTRFGDDYWLARDDDGVFPFEFHRAMADAGWLGITMPEEYGGSGLGVTEASIMMHEVASHGGGMSATSAVHINLFGPHPIVVKGTPDQKARWVPRLVAGEDQCCFGFTEPDAGLNTTRIKTFAQKVPGGYLVHGQKVWTSTAQVANKIMLLTRTTKYEDCARPTASRSSTPISIGRRSMFIASRKWAARRSIRTPSLSTVCLFRRPTGSARRAGVFHIFCTASIRSGS
jgi:acyl-CoA dehydrogenase